MHGGFFRNGWCIRSFSQEWHFSTEIKSPDWSAFLTFGQNEVKNMPPLTSSTSISHREVVAIALHSLSSPQELFWIWQETMVWEEFVWKNFCCWLLLKDLLHHQPSSLLWFIITRNWNILGSVSDLKIQFFRLSVAIFPTCIYFKTTKTSLWVNFFEI